MSEVEETGVGLLGIGADGEESEDGLSAFFISHPQEGHLPHFS